MKLSGRYHFIITVAILCILAGTLNYYLFRPDILLFNISGLQSKPMVIDNELLEQFLKNHFSDITWCISLCCIAFAFAELKYISITGKYLLLTLPFITEILQYYTFINGSFDWLDILTYAIIISIFYSLFPAQKIIYEKD